MKRFTIVLFAVLALSTLSCELFFFFGNRPGDRFGHAMVYIGNDTIVMFGGTTGSASLGDTWEYNTADYSWTEVATQGDIPPAQANHALAWISGTKALMFGSAESEPGTWEYDSSTKTWTKIPIAVGDQPMNRVAHAMTSIGNSKVLLFGGTSGGWETWIYDGTLQTWEKIQVTGNSPESRYGHDDLVYLEESSTVVLFGGNCWESTTERGYQQDDTWIYDISAQTWENVSNDAFKPSPPREHIAISRAGGNTILMHGGAYYPSGKNATNQGQQLLSDMWEFDIQTQKWTQVHPTGSDPGALNVHAMEYVGNNTVFMYSGSAMYEMNSTAHKWIRRN